MQLSGIKSNNFIYLAALKACIMRYALQEGRRMHQETINTGLLSDVVVGSTLVDMYAKCGSIEESQQVFYQLRNPDLISWNVLIRGYVQNDQGILALNCFEHMQEKGIKPDKVTFPSILKACCIIGAIQHGRLIHNWILRRANESDVVVGNTLLDMYAKCGSLGEASNVFDRLPYQDMVSFAAMIAGYTEHDEGECALDCFVKMQEQEINPDAVTFLSILKACGSIGAIEQGRLVHDQILKLGIKSNVAVRSTLVDMYAKCGSLEESCKVFEELPDRDLVSWDAMLAGFALHGKGHSALDCFEWMQAEGTKPGSFTFSSILKACGSIGAIENGRFFHVQSLENRFDWDVIVGNTLIDMYSKSGSLEESQKVFDKMVHRNVISWGELISCYAQHGEDFLALDYYRKMQMENIEPNKLTILAVIKACGKVGAIDQGRSIHEQIVKGGFHRDILMDNSIIDMYIKCGNLEESFSVFERLTDRNVVSWNAMIGGYAQHGEGLRALHCFKKMQKEGIKPDRVTFLCILSACSHAGLVDTGQCYFQHMNENHGITPDMDHYSCMVDLLGRAGYLKEAEDLLQIIEQPGISGWMSLLGACRMHTNREF